MIQEVNMAEKHKLSDMYGDQPPPYTPVDTRQSQTLLVGANSSLFHNGARFDEFAKPVIPPPPPGCSPNQYQMMQMKKGQLSVMLNDSRGIRHQNTYGTF